MGVYDLPASIDYILGITGQKKLFYVGHSQGCTSLFVLLSEKPEYNEKIIKIAAYAPIVYTNHMRSPIISLLNTISTPLFVSLKILFLINRLYL